MKSSKHSPAAAEKQIQNKLGYIPTFFAKDIKKAKKQGKQVRIYWYQATTWIKGVTAKTPSHIEIV
jgi:hypothetical protein